MRNPQRSVQQLDLHARLFSHEESEPDLHRIDVVVSRLRHKPRQRDPPCPFACQSLVGMAFIS